MDAAHLAGSAEALLRVIVSDGLNVGSDVSDENFSVEPKPPSPFVISPAEGASYAYGHAVVLEAGASDLEEDAITDDSRFHWYSDLQGELGQGRELRYEDLERGTHTISVRVADGDGFVGGDSVRVRIGNQLLLPLVQR